MSLFRFFPLSSARVALIALTLAGAPCARPAAASPPAQPAPLPEKPLTDEQKKSLALLDSEMERLAALLAEVTDVPLRATVKRNLDGFKERRQPLRQEFDSAAYDELLLAVTVEYQRLLAWMAPPTTPPPKRSPRAPAKSGAS